MTSPLLNIIMQYSGAVSAGIVVSLLCKAFYASQMRTKIRNYQSDIVKSHAKILELEAKSDRLEKRLKEAEGIFNNDRILMN